MHGVELFIEQHHDALATYARVLAGNRNDGDDLLSESLLSICKHWRRVAQADHPLAYARRIVSNTYFKGRSRWNTRMVIPTEPALVGVGEVVAGVDEAVVRRQSAEDALACLEPRDRVLVVLRYYYELTHAEIAAELGMNEATVRTRIHRALQQIRQRQWI